MLKLSECPTSRRLCEKWGFLIVWDGTLLSVAFGLGLEVDRMERHSRPLAFGLVLDFDRDGWHPQKFYFFCCAYSFAPMKCSDT